MKSLCLTIVFKNIDWKWLSQGIPTYFHGDFQPENIIVNSSEIMLIDWRHQFTNDFFDIGDLYYDYSKMQHALTVSGEIVRNHHFFCSNIKNDKIELNFYRKNNLVTFENLLHKYILKKNHDLKKVLFLEGLIFLNIAKFYEINYSRFVFYLGQLKLSKLIQELKI